MNRPAVALLLASLASPALAQNAAFTPGPVFSFGKVAKVDATIPIPKSTVFKIAFDGTEAGKDGAINRSLETAARFINMNVAACLPRENIHLAVVLHGPPVFDVASDAAYARQHPGKTNPNKAAIAELLAKNVRIIVCGQSAASLGVAKAELLPGVELALSAMTIHAQLQQQGYTINPF